MNISYHSIKNFQSVKIGFNAILDTGDLNHCYEMLNLHCKSHFLFDMDKNEGQMVNGMKMVVLITT